MQSRPTYDLQTAARTTSMRRAAEAELNILRDVFRMLPAGVTVQDEHGDFLLVNDAAAAQLEDCRRRAGSAAFASIEPAPRNRS